MMSKPASKPEFFPKARWKAMIVLFLASFMNLVDVTIVNVALPAIQSDLGASDTMLEWIVAAYVLCFAVGLLPSGRFGDAYGRKGLFLWGITGFAVSSLICGFAQSTPALILGRAALGLTGALMIPQVLAIVHVIFPPQEKAKVFGIFGVIASLGAVTGNLLGGLIIEADIGGLGWRPIFLINVPISAMIVLSALRWVPTTPKDRGASPDVGSIALFALAAFTVIFPLIEGRNLGWPWWNWVIFASGAVWAAFFVQRQKMRASREQSQLIPYHLIVDPSFTTGLFIVVLFFSGLPGLFLVLSVFFQTGQGMTPLQSGLATAPFPIFAMLSSVILARSGNIDVTRRLVIGTAVLSGGALMMRGLLGLTSAPVTIWTLSIPLAICGVGLGTAVTVLFPSILARVAPQHAGAGSGTLQTLQQIGAALGIAISGHIFFSTLGAAQDFTRAAQNAMLFSAYSFGLVTVLQVVLRR